MAFLSKKYFVQWKGWKRFEEKFWPVYKTVYEMEGIKETVAVDNKIILTIFLVSME